MGAYKPRFLHMGAVSAKRDLMFFSSIYLIFKGAPLRTENWAVHRMELHSSEYLMFISMGNVLNSEKSHVEDTVQYVHKS